MEDRWKKSREFLVRAEGSLAGGVSSPFRRKSPVPLFFRDGSGCRLEDVDGNRYIDYGLGWGPLILGHRHPGPAGNASGTSGTPLPLRARSTSWSPVFPSGFNGWFPVPDGWRSLPVAAKRCNWPCVSREPSPDGSSWSSSKATTTAGWDSILASYHPAPDEIGTVERPPDRTRHPGSALGRAGRSAGLRLESNGPG